MPKILVADDDLELLESVRTWLEHNRFVVDVAADGRDAREFMTQFQYDVLVIDWRMPEVNGLDLCLWFRATGGQTPILMLTGKTEIEDKEAGLDAGADDYLTKPFALRELTARLNALTRRGKVLASRVRKVGPLTVDPDAHTALIDGAALKLTVTEFAILEFLARHQERVFSSEAIIRHVWTASSQISPDTVRVHIKRLREKLEVFGHPHLLVNLHGVGYKLAA